MKRTVPAGAPPPKKINDKAMTLVEIMVVAAIIGLAFMFIGQMISTGVDNVTASVWHADRLKESQFFFKLLGDDMHMAATEVNINYNNVLNEVTRTPRFLNYLRADSSAIFVNPFSAALGGANTNAATTYNVLNGEAANERTIIAFDINKTNVTGNSPAASAGYKVAVRVILDDKKRNGKPDPKLYYEKRLVSGDANQAKEDNNIMAKKAMMNDVEFVYMAHKNTSSQLNPGEVAYSMFYILVKLKDWQDPNSPKSKEFTKGIKVPIETREM